MKSKWDIIIVVVFLLVILSYRASYTLYSPAIKVKEISMEDRNTLCFQIKISSIDYIDSLVVAPQGATSDCNKRVFVFDENIRRASITYFCHNAEQYEKLIFSLSTYNANKTNDFESILTLNTI